MRFGSLGRKARRERELRWEREVERNKERRRAEGKKNEEDEDKYKLMHKLDTRESGC